MKELPKMYRNRIEKEITNNKRVFSTMESDRGETLSIDRSVSTTKSDLTVEQKIARIFNSPNYIYKVDVVIVTDSGTHKKRIVGKTVTNLITMDSEYIPINTIKDIYVNK